MQRFRKLSIFLTVLAALGAVFFVASASAFPVYQYSTQFGSRGTGNGQFSTSGPNAAAVDAAGNFWVVDSEGHNVQKFNAKGEFLLKITEGNKHSFGALRDVAVDSAGNIWVSDAGGKRLVEFSSTGAYIREFGEFGSGPGQFYYPNFIAIDSSGNLWVTDYGNERVQEFSSTGKYIRQFGSAGTGNGQFTYMSGIAIDAEQNVWVSDSGAETTRVEEFSSSGAYIKQIGSSTLSYTSEDSLSIYGGNLWVSDYGHNCVKVLNTSGEVLTQFGGVEASEGSMIWTTGIAFDLSGNPWVVNPSIATIEKWVPAPPVATTEAASSVKASEATLNAQVNPEGSSTTYQFEYGTTTSYGKKAPVSPASAGSGVGNVAVKQAVSGLTPSTTYHYRIVATSSAGTAKGADKTFTTTSLFSQQLENVALINAFDGSSGSLSNFATNWSTLGWASEKGAVTKTGWRPVEAFPKVAGTYYSEKQTDAGSGIANVITMYKPIRNPERYFSLWLDMSTPSGAKNGYELRVTDTGEAEDIYTVTLSKWASGVKTELASKAGITTIGAGTSLALVDKGSTVSAWLKTGAEFTSLLSATDSSFASGQSGMEDSGNSIYVTNFKTGTL